MIIIVPLGGGCGWVALSPTCIYRWSAMNPTKGERLWCRLSYCHETGPVSWASKGSLSLSPPLTFPLTWLWLWLLLLLLLLLRLLMICGHTHHANASHRGAENVLKPWFSMSMMFLDVLIPRKIISIGDPKLVLHTSFRAFLVTCVRVSFILLFFPGIW